MAALNSSISVQAHDSNNSTREPHSNHRLATRDNIAIVSLASGATSFMFHTSATKPVRFTTIM
jgi:hypothetical protein